MQDSQGRTALLAALFFGQYSVASTLMEMGADVMAHDEAGNTALAIANERWVLFFFCVRKWIGGRSGLLPARALSAFFGIQCIHVRSAWADQTCSPYNVLWWYALFRLLTPGSDKRVLRRFLRLYRARDTARRNTSSSGMLQSMLSALRDEGGSSSHVDSDSGSAGEAGRLFRKKSVSRSSSRGKQGLDSAADPRLSRSDGEVNTHSTARGAATSPSSSSRKRTGKKLKLEPKTVLQVAKLPMSLFRGAKTK